MLHQAFAHCAIFPTAASRRSLGRVSVPVWPVTLSGRLPVVGLVSHYLTNYLIGRESILDQNSFHQHPMPGMVVSGIRRRFQRLSQSQGQVTHVLLTRSPLITGASSRSSFDLHVLSTPPAFVLSQDQTLRKCLIAQHPKVPAHYLRQRTGIGPEAASLKLTEQIITDLLCCLNVFQRNPKPNQKRLDYRVFGI